MKDDAKKVLDFWFSDRVRPKWFLKDPDFDGEIKQTFEGLYNWVRGQGRKECPATAQEYLAWVIVLDQFPRNMFRGSPQAFATDAQALWLSGQAIGQGMDKVLPKQQRKFLYMPFMHAEFLEAQEEGLLLFKAMDDPQTYGYAVAHRDIIKQFGRFPHRNQVLGRSSTPQELAFLTQPGTSF